MGFKSRARRIWASPLTGGIFSVLGIGLEAALLLGAPIGIDQSLRRQYLIWGFIFVIFVAIQAFWALHKQKREAVNELGELKARFNPQLEIVFAPQNDSDSRPYLQTLTFGQITDPSRSMIEMRDRRYRVGVHNATAATAHAVSLRLESCQPGGNFVFPEHELAVQDTNPLSGSCDISPGETRWFDVVNELGPASAPPAHFHFCYRNSDFSRLPVPAGTYEITLRAEGSGPSVKQKFQIVKKWHDPQTFERLVLEINHAACAALAGSASSTMS